MLIKETIERECCQEQDFLTYNGDTTLGRSLIPTRFCIRCGQIWIEDKPQPGVSLEHEWRKAEPPR